MRPATSTQMWTVQPDQVPTSSSRGCLQLGGGILLLPMPSSLIQGRNGPTTY